MSVQPPPDESVTRRVELKGFRIDLVIAVCALFVSSLATAASVWQSRVVAQQLSSQVWPYLSLVSSYDGKSASLTLSNEGLGPARLRSAVVSVDGVPHRTLTEVLRVLVPGKTVTPQGTFTDLRSGGVIRVGGTVTLFRIVDPPSMSALVRNYNRLGIRICYCPIIPGNCWIVGRDRDRRESGDPETVPDCPDVGDMMFQSGIGPMVDTKPSSAAH